ncbi:MAG: hypothetical protein ACRC7W_05955 [Fusobacteriaceae bacterium]
MEKKIVDGKKTKVIYDTERKIYIKTFNPDDDKKLKYLLGMRIYPGRNFKVISDYFNANGIKTPKIIAVDKYKVVTEEVEGRVLKDFMQSCEPERQLFLIDLYIEIVAKIINLGVYFGDFNFGNFIVSNDELCAIDLEDYRRDFFSNWRRKSLLKRLKRFLLERNYQELVMSGEDIYEKIIKKIR